jgi:DNA-binding NtrC family response regulator/tetratricopeptide (TPR) repeat protein
MARSSPSSRDHPTERLMGQSSAMHALRLQLRHLATFDTLGNPHAPTVLLQGETGTGKGLIARILHDSGPRAAGPFLEVNCAAIPETLLEAELFGFEAGTFTDAKRAKPGLWEAASRGTLFLDEVAELPLPLQSKLLKVIEDKHVRRLGAVTERAVDVKLTAATQAELSILVQAGRFRADLYHRLSVVFVRVPPLRERREDILVLAQYFLAQYGAAHGLQPRRLSAAADTWLQGYDWPGNVRELSHLMERITLFSRETIVAPDTLEELCLPRLPSVHQGDAGLGRHAAETVDERARLLEALRHTSGNVVQAARRLGLSRAAIRHRMARYGITPPRVVPPPRSPAIGGQAGPPLSEVRLLESTRESSPASASTWEEKPVAVLALELTWPAVSVGDAAPYEPWTAAHRWEQIILEKVQGFGGVCLQCSPSLLLVVFGLPQTLEQLPQRAVQAALAVRQVLVADTRPDGEVPRPTLRLVVHLGQVLGESGANDPVAQLLPVGEALALPVRLLGQSLPGEIVVSASVARLVRGWFELESRAGLSGDRPPDEIEVSAVVGLRPQPLPLGMQGPRPLIRFVGRARELAILQDLLAQVEGGLGQVVGIVGEPGVGKTRLLYEFRQQVGVAVEAAPPGDRVRYLEGNCLAYGSALPYLPVLDLLRAECQIGDTDSAEAITEKVRLTLETVGMDPEEGTPYLLLLLGVQTGRDPLAMLRPDTIKARTFATLRELYLHSSQRHPLVLAIENLHWIDQTTEAFFASLVEGMAGARLLVLATYRPGYRSPWIEKSYVTQLVLPPLSAQDSRRLLRSLLPTEDIPESLVQQILAKAQGNPFFLEELVQALGEQGVLGRGDAGGTTGQLPRPTAIQLPSTVQAVLAARLYRLPTAEKALLRTLAVIGPVISARLLSRVVDQADVELRQWLSHLQAGEFLYERPAGPELEYVFKHALTQEAAYASLPGEQRRVTHVRTAQAIETLYAQQLEDHYGELAHHYRHSGHPEKAVVYLQRAGRRAHERSATGEAIRLLTTGLELLQTLPDTPERSRQELAVQITLGQALMAAKGQAAPEVEHAYTRARELCERVGDTAQLHWVLGGLRGIYEVRGELAKARELGEEHLSLAHRAKAPTRLADAHTNLGLVLFYVGELAQAWAHLERGMARNDSMQDWSATLRDGQQIPGVRCRRIAAWILWWLGYPD